MADSLSFDEIFISNIFQKYLKVKILLGQIDGLEEKAEEYGKTIVSDLQKFEYQQHLKIVDTILALMPKEEYTCLIKEFLNVDDEGSIVDKSWWEQYYPKKIYQDLRSKAINRFLYLFLI